MTQVSDSKNFLEFIKLTLAVGNYLNANFQKKMGRGGAHGFYLKSLTKLHDTKTVPLPQITLMQYLCNHCIRNLKQPEIVDYDQAWDTVCRHHSFRVLYQHSRPLPPFLHHRFPMCCESHSVKSALIWLIFEGKSRLCIANSKMIIRTVMMDL